MGVPACAKWALILAAVVTLAGVPRVMAADARMPTTQEPQTAPCYRAAIAALTRQGAIYSQGGNLPNDPIDPASGVAYSRSGPASFDCSGLVWWAYAQAGVSIGQTTYSQANNGTAIDCSLADLQGASTRCWTLGDLIFLRYNGGQHVAIYAGAGLFMDCYNHAVGCILHDVTADSFYAAHFWQARRIVSGCEGLTHDPGQPIANPALGGALPDLEQIPALLAPLLLLLPWHCSACGDDGVTTLVPLPEPDVGSFHWYDMGSWFNWLIVQLWNHLTLPLLCWLLALAQALLTALEVAVNTLIDGINWFWRLAIMLIFWLRALVFLAWTALLWFRDMLWSIAAMVSALGLGSLAGLAELLTQARDLVGALLTILVALALAVLQALLYLFALLLTIVPGLVSAVSHLSAPPQVTALADFFLLVWMRELLQALADSKLGWAWAAFVALFYARFLLWLLDQTSSLNA